jgi:Flp pilus assembly protein TadD
MLASLYQAGCAQTSGVLSPGAPGLEGGAATAAKELPPDAAAQLCLATAEALEKGGKHVEAIQLYEKARQKDPRLQHVCRRLAVLYDRQGNFPRAQQEYDQALKLQPDDPSLLNDLGYSHYCRGNLDEAERLLRQSLAKNPTAPRTWTNLGLVLGQKGQYAESLEAFEKIVGTARAQCNLGFILTTQGKRDEARAAYREALRLDPGLKLAEGALARLEKGEVITVSAERREGEKAPARPLPVVAEEPIVVDPAAGVPAEPRPKAPVSPPGIETGHDPAPSGGLQGQAVSREWCPPTRVEE